MFCLCLSLRIAPDLNPCHRNILDEVRGSASNSNSQSGAAVQQSLWQEPNPLAEAFRSICVLQTTNTAGSQRDSVTAWYSHQLVAVSFRAASVSGLKGGLGVATGDFHLLDSQGDVSCRHSLAEDFGGDIPLGVNSPLQVPEHHFSRNTKPHQGVQQGAGDVVSLKLAWFRSHVVSLQLAAARPEKYIYRHY